MEFTIAREALYRPLQRIVGAVEKKQALPILSNVLITVKSQLLSLVGTDLEVEIIARVPLTHKAESGETTVSAKKLVDICRALPDAAEIHFALKDNKVTIKSGRSRFSLACLPATDFPKIEEGPGQVELSLSSTILSQLFEYTSFSMAQQDVRYYLNGLLLTFSANEIRSVATDGHRLVTQVLPIQTNLSVPIPVIIPRKAVLELERLFTEEKEDLGIVVSDSHLRAISTSFSFSTKLVEGKFPNYQRVLPQTTGHQAILSRELFKRALTRVAVLFSDKFRGARFLFSENNLKILATNSEKDEVEEELEIQYSGPEIEIGFNISYIQEYLAVIKSIDVVLHLFDPNSSVLFEPKYTEATQAATQYSYVVMPMRI
jgi:DNA polymerase-3 subunit beta